MTQPLIRPEVFAARRQQWLGEARVGLPSLAGGLIVLAVLSALVLLLLLTFGSYTRRASVVGEIVPAAGLLRMDAQAAGVVSALYVDEGSKVKRGQTLLLISVEQTSAALGDTGSLVAQQLSAQAQRIDQRLQSGLQEAARGAEVLQQELRALAAEQALMHVQKKLRVRQVDQARAALQRVSPLQRSGVMATRQIEEYAAALLDAEDALNETELRLLDQQRRIRATNAELAALPGRNATEETQWHGEQTALTQALAQTEARRVLRVVAPSDGVVSGLGVQLGQSVTAERRLLSLIPADSELVAQLWVPSSAIGRLAPGDRVLLRMDAFSHQQYGRIDAIIEQVAETALSPEAIHRIADRVPDYPAFRVIARLPQLPGTMPVRASMRLTGDLQLERRRLIQWLYAPLRAVAGAGAP